jgi:hypothetical protein
MSFIYNLIMVVLEVLTLKHFISSYNPISFIYNYISVVLEVLRLKNILFLG